MGTRTIAVPGPASVNGIQDPQARQAVDNLNEAIQFILMNIGALPQEEKRAEAVQGKYSTLLDIIEIMPGTGVTVEKDFGGVRRRWKISIGTGGTQTVRVVTDGDWDGTTLRLQKRDITVLAAGATSWEIVLTAELCET